MSSNCITPELQKPTDDDQETSMRSLSQLSRERMLLSLAAVKTKHIESLVGESDLLDELLLKELDDRLFRVDWWGDKGMNRLLDGCQRVDVKRDTARWDTIIDLRDKCLQGLSVLEEHKDDEIPLMRRVQLECRTFDLIEDSLHYIEDTCRQFTTRATDDQKLVVEDQEIRFRTRYLDRVFGEVHVHFIEAYLAT